MNRSKRLRRESTADRASEDTTTSSASNSSAQPVVKRLRRDDGREPSSTPGPGDAQPPSPNSCDLIEELFSAVVQQADEKGRMMISVEFSLLPSRKVYPDYYRIIVKPIDLKQVAQKIQKNEYSSLDGLVEDLTLMANNAIQYNIPSSQIHREAVALKKFVAHKKTEYETREQLRTAERTVRTRRSVAQMTQPVSAVFAALEYGDDVEDLTDDEEEEDVTAEETMEADSDDETSQDTGSIITRQDSGDDKSKAMFDLFNSVVKLKGTTSRVMSGPFMKLPSKRIYPQYYTAIEHPIALSNIKAKIKNGLYVAIDEVFQDLLLMCQNARTFNDNNSIIYRNSERFRKFVEGKQAEFREEVEKLSSPLRRSLSERLLPEYTDYPIRKRAKFIVRSILEYGMQNGYLSEDFLEKPPKKEYPDYYDVITQPMDIKTLVTKVAGDKYVSEEALLADINLMCTNAKLYNEEGSDIYEAAATSEQITAKCLRILDAALAGSGAGPSTSHGSSPRRTGGQTRRASIKFPPPTSPLQAALIELYEHITDIPDAEDPERKLCSFFQTLPLKTEMPSYYDVIKKPMDLDRIQYKIIHDQYQSFQDAIEDFGQMCENAAAFNEPTSAIYRDALVLLNAVMSKSSSMKSAFVEIPNVQQKVQEILRTLMDSILNFTKDGRNLSDTIAECTWNDSDSDSDGNSNDSDSSTRTPLTLEVIKSNVYSGRYRRLDRFQDDMFELLEKARFTAQPDSQTYEDAVELHVHFITTRDELCGNGTKLLTAALHYTVTQFNTSIEQERKEAKLRPPSNSRQASEAPTTSGRSSAIPPATLMRPPPTDPNVKCVMVGVDAFYSGDFVYVEPYEKGKPALIVCIQELIDEENGDQTVKGCYMLRPEETFHPAGRRFLEKEVFKSDMIESHKPGRILGRCFVMGSKDYFKMKPVGLDGKDVYVCDSRYNTKTKTFRKIKVWKTPENSYVQLVPRETPLPANWVPSVFANQSRDVSSKPETSTAGTDSTFPLCKDSEIIDVIREPVLAKTAVPEDGILFYDQKEFSGGFIKIGDCFLVRNGLAERIIKIEKIFDKGSDTMISGGIFVFPKDLPATLILPGKLFYQNEVFQKVTEETVSVKELSTRCAVLSLKDFASCRQTEISEARVFVVETKIMENGMAVRRPKSQRLLNVSTAGSSHATDDEVYFFDQPVSPRRVVSPLLEPVLSGKVVEVDRTPEESPLGALAFDDDSMSISHASEISFATPHSPAASTAGVTSAKKKRGASGKKQKKAKYTVSGFILYGADNRRSIKEANPKLTFQETSRYVSDLWKGLPAAERKKWEDEAKRKSGFVNAEMRSRGFMHLDGISFKGLGSKKDVDLVVELEKRAQQQELNIKEEERLAKEAKETKEAQLRASTPSTSTSGSTNHASTSQPSTSGSQSPQKSDPNSAAKPEQPQQVNMLPPQTLALLQSQQQQFQRLLQQQQQQALQQQQQVQRPLFMTCPAEPPKVKRALHSEVFLRYLENNGMGESPKPAVPYWKRQLTAAQDTSPLPRQVPDYWPSLLNIDADTRNKGMELVSRMWSVRNLIFTKTCGLTPVPVSTTHNITNTFNTAPAPSQVFTPPLPATPLPAKERSARRPTSGRR